MIITQNHYLNQILGVHPLDPLAFTIKGGSDHLDWALYYINRWALDYLDGALDYIHRRSLRLSRSECSEYWNIGIYFWIFFTNNIHICIRSQTNLRIIFLFVLVVEPLTIYIEGALDYLDQSVANIGIYEYIFEYSSQIIFIFVFLVKQIWK